MSMSDIVPVIPDVCRRLAVVIIIAGTNGM